MKHDARSGWCICGERHDGKLPKEAAPAAPKVEKPVTKVVEKARREKKTAVVVKKPEPPAPPVKEEKEVLAPPPFHVAYPRLF